ncbi:MAG TPA: CopD family protein, partial [Ilumatobacteraceae bacterium]|nr:CopD family protein [Ilumatobacteraceae bacterium]
SQPTAGATLPTPPINIVITFDQTIGPSVSARIVCNGNPQPAAPTNPSQDLKSIVVDLAAVVLPKGTCDVHWAVIPTTETVVSSGTITFQIANDASAPTSSTVAGSAATPTTTASSGTSADAETTTGDLSGPLGLARLLSMTTLAMLFGAIVLIAIAWPEGTDYVATIRYLRIVWLAAVISTGVMVACMVAQVSGSSFTSALMPTAWTDLTDTTPGLAALARMGLTVAVGWVVIQPDRINVQQLPSLALAAFAVATMGFTRSGGDLELIGYAAGIFHALAMAVWFGGVVLLARVVLLGPGEEDLVHAVRGFSKMATPAIAITVLTGAFQLYRLDRGHLTDSNHGRLLVVKILPVIGMVIVGTATRQFIRARFAREDVMTTANASRLRRVVGMEAMLGLAVLGLTAWMLNTQPANLRVGVRTAADYRVHIPLATADGVLDVAFGLDPGRVGTNEMLLEVVAPSSGITSITINFTPPAAQPNATAVSIAITELTGAGAIHIPRSVGIPLDQPGEWNVGVDIALANGTVLRQTVLVTITGTGTIVTEIPVVTSPPVTAVATTTTTTPPAG